MRVAAGAALLLVAGLAGSVAWFAMARRAPTWFDDALLRDLSTIGDPARRAGLHERGRIVSRGRRDDVHRALAVVAVRVSCAVAAFPLLAACAVIGIVAGLLRRHVLRELYGFSSLTFSYVGKMLVGASLGAYAFIALSPVALALWWLYVALLALVAGATLYVGNLPPKI